MYLYQRGEVKETMWDPTARRKRCDGARSPDIIADIDSLHCRAVYSNCRRLTLCAVLYNICGDQVQARSSLRCLFFSLPQASLRGLQLLVLLLLLYDCTIEEKVCSIQKSKKTHQRCASRTIFYPKVVDIVVSIGTIRGIGTCSRKRRTTVVLSLAPLPLSKSEK